MEGVPALDAALIQRVPKGTFGPYLGVSGPHRIAIWAALTPDAGRRWFSVALDPRGAPVGAARALADASDDLVLASVAPSPTGFVVLATALTATGTRLEVLQLGLTGELASGPTPLDDSRTEVVWIDTLRVGQKAVALWATLASGSADLRLAPLEATGIPSTAAITVSESVQAWQAVEFGDGIALSTINTGASPAQRALRVLFLDTNGQRLGQTEVTRGKALEAQLDSARVGDNLVLAWTQLDGLEPRLQVAAIGPDTRLAVPPRPASGAFGAQRLFSLVPSDERRGDAVLVWENIGQAPRGQQRFQLGRITAQAALEGASTELSFSGKSFERPEFARKGQGLVALTIASACTAADVACEDRPVPSFVELGGTLEPLASEPLRLAPEAGKSADLAWGLSCSSNACAVLGALTLAPVPIYGIELRAHSNQWLPLARSVPSATRPRPTEMRALLRTDALADVRASAVGKGWLVATLTQFDESTPYVKRTTAAPDGRLAPLRALLSVQPVNADGKVAGTERVISLRARATSGIALTRAPDNGALLGWTALDRQRPEVFATLLDRTGQPVVQRMVTLDAGEVSSLDATTLGQGFLLAWIAERNQGQQVFVAKLGADLNRTLQQPLTFPPGTATALNLLASPDATWLAWVRDAESEQTLFVTRIDPKTLARLGADVPIQSSQAGTLLSPSLVALGEGALLGWVERPALGGQNGSRAWLVELDANAKPKAEPMRIGASAGDPAAVRLFCTSGHCLGALDSRPPSGHLLEGFVWEPGGAAPSAEPLVRRATMGADSPAFATVASALFYADRSDRRGLLRRVDVEWH